MTSPKASASAGTLLFCAVLLAGCGSFGPQAGTKPAPVKPAPAKSAGAAGGAAAAPAAQTAPQTPEAQFRQAVELMRARNHAEAEPLLLELTRKQPQQAGPWTNLGLLYARSNRRPQAMDALRKAVSLNPRSAVAQNQLGILLRQNGELEAAAQAYRAALAAAPGHAAAHLNLGILYDVYLKQPAQALAHYEQYHRLVPDDARAAVWIAELKQQGNARQASKP